MNLKKLSEDFMRAGIPAVLFTVTGLFVTVFAAVQILDRVWAHVALNLPNVPGLGAVAALLVGGAFLVVAALIHRHASTGRTQARG
ncbi:hypothetical protein OG206_01635 [Streptomyces sp. NBC_01341]|uniref:hypothetical protein n=1 Tax=Streptomyces sp. NBC_01341 TaxID=2903831 RepID=UPI002E14DA7B|nr:hypothetical protein OG206_01635 [Streptomyces sp. NBC_01341]